MSQAPTAEGMRFQAELNEICQLPPGLEKERRRKDWADRLAKFYSRRRRESEQRDWKQVASGGDE